MPKDVVLLTKSYMKGGFCTTGLTSSGEWLRLVRDEEGTSLLASDLQISKHNSNSNSNQEELCEPLDVVRVEIIKKVPRNNHAEDVQIKTNAIRKLGRFGLGAVLRLHNQEEHKYIFGNTSDSLTQDEMDKFSFNYSLVFVRVKNIRITYNLHKGKVSFDYNDEHYKGIRVTDPEFLPAKGIQGADAAFEKAYLVVSMPNVPYKDGLYYKFAAKIFTIA